MLELVSVLFKAAFITIRGTCAPYTHEAINNLNISCWFNLQVQQQVHFNRDLEDKKNFTKTRI